MAAAQESSTDSVRKAKSSIWNLAGTTLGGWKLTWASQRRQSTKLISNMVHGLDHVLDTDADNVLATSLAWCERTTHINRRYLLVGAFLFAVSYLSMGRSAGTLCNILAMVYPIYASIKATEGIGGYSQEHWVMYWIVYSLLNLLEVVLEIFLVWLPMYYLFKFLFLTWCMVPISANGSHVIYGNIIRPLFHQHSDAVDSALSAMTQHLTTAAETAGSRIQDVTEDDVVEQETVRHRTINTEKKDQQN